MSKINKGILRLGALVLLLALVMVIAVPAFADNTTPTTPVALHTVQGKVINISNTSNAGSFTIQNGDKQVIINTDANTKYYMINMGKAQGYVNSTINEDNQQARKNGRSLPSKANDLRNAHIPANWRDNMGWLDTFDAQANLSNIQVGDRVFARVDSNSLARSILIIKAPVIKTVKGTVKAVPSGNIIAITPAGSTTTLSLNVTPETRIVLKGLVSIQQGQSVVAVYNSSNSNALTINIQTAQ